MLIVSSREFRYHQNKYLDLIGKNEQSIIQRSKDNASVIIPLNDADRFSVNDHLIQTVINLARI
jgi:hypothetical protein